MFTMMVGWREGRGGGGEGGRETRVRVMCESEGKCRRDVGDCSGLAPLPRGREKALKSPS